MQVLRVCLTFDVDFTNHADSGGAVNEFASVFPSILSVFQRHTFCNKATWFIRLDAQIETLYGQPDYILQRYKNELCGLWQAGHEIGWHPHCYIEVEGEWRQNLDVSSVVDELLQYAPLAQSSYGMRSVRMGWGFHKNETMRLFAARGFVVDSSAIPRPRYQWEETQKDWTLTPIGPYLPSRLDYRVPGEPALPILEVPMSVTHIKAPYDTERVLRYINLAYHPGLLREPLERWLIQQPCLITITHPYELLPRKRPHGLLAFDVDAFEQNLTSIQEIARKQGILLSFVTISEFAREVTSKAWHCKTTCI